MPLLDRNGTPAAPDTINMGVPYGVRDDDSEGETPSFGQTASANFRLNSWWVSAMQSQRGVFPEAQFDPGFDPWERIQGTPLEAHWERFADSRNASDFEDIRADIEAEERARDVLSRSSLAANIGTGLAVGVADPTILLPGAIAVRAPKLGYSTVKTALMTGALNAGIAGAEEAFLHASQQTRTADETKWNVLGSALIGSILGAGFAKVLTRAEIDGLARKAMDDIAAGPAGNPDVQAFSNVIDASNRFVADSASKQPVPGGSAAVTRPSIEDLSVDGATAKRLAQIAKVNPIARSLFYASAEARNLMFRLAENSVYLTGTAKGKTTGPAVENLVGQWTKGVLSTVIESHGSVYRDFVKAGGRLSRSQFNDAVGAAMRRGDQSTNPHVAQAAQLWRAQVFDPLTQRAIKNGLLPEDVSPTTAISYFSRVWNRKRLRAEEFPFKDAVKKYFRNVVAKNKFDSNAEFESYIGDIADSVFDKLTGRGGDFGFDFQKITVSARGPLKERTFNVPDELIERWLDSDVERVGARFTRVMAADVELAERFPDSIDQGTKRVTLNGSLQKVREDYKRLREEANANPDLKPEQKAKLLAKLNDEEGRAIEDIESVRDLLRGTYAQNLQNTTYARISRIATTFQYVVKMGDVVKSSLTDTARPMMVHGFTPYLKGFARLATDPQFRKIAKAEARRAGAIGQRALEARLATWADISDPYLADTPFERFAGNAARVFTRLSGIAMWNDWQRTVSSALTESRLVKNVMKEWGALSQQEQRYMAYLGIDRDMAERMRGQVDRAKAGKDAEDFWHSGTDTWKDEEAKRTFWAAIDKDVNSTIVTPGVGDLPLFQRTPTGRMLLQFKSYVLASHQKALIRAVQEGGYGQAAGVMLGMLSATTIGMAIVLLTAIETNRMEDLSENPGTWIAEGLDRSGMFSLLFEVNNSMERVVPGLGVYGALEGPFDAPGIGGASRFGYRPPSSLLTGPTGGTIDDFARVFSDPRKATTLLPGRTLPYVRPFLEWGLRPELEAQE